MKQEIKLPEERESSNMNCRRKQRLGSISALSHLYSITHYDEVIVEKRLRETLQANRTSTTLFLEVSASAEPFIGYSAENTDPSASAARLTSTMYSFNIARK